MRVHKQTSSGDYQFGHSSADLISNSPETVAQVVLTSLRLVQGEWFIDTSAGVPYYTAILGKNRQATADQAVRQAILNAQGVSEIIDFSSTLLEREYKVRATIKTAYADTVSTIVSNAGPSQLDYTFILDESLMY